MGRGRAGVRLKPDTGVGRPLVELLSLEGKAAIITGAGHGLGLAVARRLAEAGAAVVLNDLDAERVEVSAATIPGALAAAGDVADPDSVDHLVARCVEAHGRVDVLVNNAGIWPRKPFLEADPELWRRTLDVNLTGQLLCARAVARRLVEQGEGGAIVNIASIAANVPHPDDLIAYGASKAGVVNATRSLAKALAPHRIRVNAVLPGGMETPGVQGTARRQGADIPLGRRADPDEVATAVLFLASPLAGYITGAELVVDGGATLV